MAKLSRGTKETIKTVVVLVVIILLVLLYIVYPLNRTKASMGRTDFEAYLKDTLPRNDDSAWVAQGWTVDTFRVESDGMTRLAGVLVNPSSVETRGTAILVPAERATRDSVISLARQFLSEGYAVVSYDQRASGRSSNKYHSDGQMEATDLQAVISHLGIHNQLHSTLVVVGYKAGGDAALLTAEDEPRITALAAVDPYLTTDRMMAEVRQQHPMFWFPFSKHVFWWWYGIRSGYVTEYRGVKDIRTPGRPSVVVVPQALESDASVQKLKEAGGEMVTVRPEPISDHELVVAVLARAGK